MAPIGPYGTNHPAFTMIQISLVAVTQGTAEEKGQLGFDKKNLGFKVKRTLCFRPALLCVV